MSEVKDSFMYNFYDFMKTIFVYSHVKTYLLDKGRQDYEVNFDNGLLAFAYIFLIISGFKVLIIIFYFIFIQAFSAFINFVRTLCKTKFKINYCLSLINAFNYLAKVGKRIFTFNFYLYQNNIIGIIMILSYFFFLICSLGFYQFNLEEIENTEKSEDYMYYFYLHFESIVLIQILISSFYSCRNMKISIVCALSIFLLLNGILLIGYFITDRIESVDGIFEYDDPQKVMNIIFNSIFLLLNGSSLFLLMKNNFISKENSYKLLMEEKQNFYEKNNVGEPLLEMEENKLKNIKKTKLNLKGLYYSLDNHNIFKRVDRYKSMYIFKIILFLYLVGFNSFEIIFNIVLFYSAQKHSNDYTKGERILTLIFNMMNIIVIQILASITVLKLKINILIYY